MIQYPEGLPLPLRDGYDFSPVDSKIRTEMITGRARQRRRYLSTPTFSSVRWLMTNTQAQLFESWYEDVLISGVEWFEMSLKTPQGIQLYRCRFVGSYEGPTLDAHYWRFTATLELFEKPIPKGNWAPYAPQFMLYMAEIDKAINSDWPEA